MIIVIMGVAGSGKSLIGRMLADELHWPFFDADDFHSAANVAKMASGIPLTDEDRRPWLAAIRATIKAVDDAVLACSALKQEFREELSDGLDVRFVHLRGTFDLIDQRLRDRPHHFFRPELLRSQFETLEAREDAIDIDVSRPPREIIDTIKNALRQ